MRQSKMIKMIETMHATHSVTIIQQKDISTNTLKIQKFYIRVDIVREVLWGPIVTAITRAISDKTALA